MTKANALALNNKIFYLIPYLVTLLTKIKLPLKLMETRTLLPIFREIYKYYNSLPTIIFALKHLAQQ